MFFEILNRFGRIPANAESKVFLTWDDWNDYSYQTLFGIFYVNEKSEKIDLGSIKIGYYGQKIIDSRRLKIGDKFEEIGDDFFSVGQDDSYYQMLNDLGSQIRDKILIGLNDIAKNPKIYEKAIKEEVTKTSLLRDVSPLSITGQFRRLSRGGARLTNYNFTFNTPSIEEVTPMTLSFDVNADSNPPTNIHILIGRNGVGKTHLIHNMVNSLMKNDQQDKYGKFSQRKRGQLFANLICVTFSAFDNFEHPAETRDKSIGISYNYIGLKEVESEGKNLLKNSDSLKEQFLASLNSCRNSSRMTKWKSAIEELETDPIFREADITLLADMENAKTLKRNGNAIFERLSSGHKIILLTITRLVETLQERSLVLIDEPEAHLHPPLLSSFMRSLSDLLIDTNAVSIIATHSPVVLQEVPRSCVWKLYRSGPEARVERLEIESFGENAGVLTQEVFGLEVTDSGFHSILKKAVENNRTYDAAVRYLNNSIGLEGRAILRSLFYQKNTGDEENQ